MLTSATQGDLNLASVVDRLTATADSILRTRQAAEADGNRRDVIRAVEVEGKVLGILLARLGVTDLSTAEALREGGLVATACGNAARESPAVAAALLRHLEAIGGASVADDLRRAISK